MTEVAKSNSGWVNMTSIIIRVMRPDGSLAAEIPPSGNVARVATRNVPVGDVGGLPVYRQETGRVTGLPTGRGLYALATGELIREATVDEAAASDSAAKDGGNGAIQTPEGVCWVEATPSLAARLIVSLAVRAALPMDARLFSPGELIRDKSGQPIGCVGLVGNGGGL